MKNWTVLFYLSFFLGFFGADRFYVGKIVSGILKLLTFGGFLIWWIIDIIAIAKGRFKDASGKIVEKQGKPIIHIGICIVIFLVFVVINASQVETKEVKQATEAAELDEATKAKLAAEVEACANKSYKTVKIGSQTWMKENLNCDVIGSKCYNNDEANCKKYGRLYDWNTAMVVCPKGWHLPNNVEWDKLYRFVDGTSGIEDPCDSETAGKFLKATSGWNNSIDGSSGSGTDKYGFSALPGGTGDSDGNFSAIGDGSWWWSATEFDTNRAHVRNMLNFYGGAGCVNPAKNGFSSVRCLRDVRQ